MLTTSLTTNHSESLSVILTVETNKLNREPHTYYQSNRGPPNLLKGEYPLVLTEFFSGPN